MPTPLPLKITRKTLLALPRRKWDEVTEYNALYIVPTGRKHDSGWGLIAIIGVNGTEAEGVKGLEAEIAAQCDDVCWTMPIMHPYGTYSPGRNRNILRTDMLWPSNIIRMWGSGEHYFDARFRVGPSLSSTNVELFIQPTGKNVVTGKTVERLSPCHL